VSAKKMDSFHILLFILLILYINISNAFSTFKAHIYHPIPFITDAGLIENKPLLDTANTD
jgi:hypothetical protein